MKLVKEKRINSEFVVRYYEFDSPKPYTQMNLNNMGETLATSKNFKLFKDAEFAAFELKKNFADQNVWSGVARTPNKNKPWIGVIRKKVQQKGCWIVERK